MKGTVIDLQKHVNTSGEEEELNIYVRHIRWFVNFLAESSLTDEKLREICSNLDGVIEQALIEDPVVDSVTFDIKVSWSHIAELNLGTMTWLGVLRIKTDVSHATVDVKEIQNLSIRLSTVVMKNFEDLNRQGKVIFDIESPMYVVLSANKTEPKIPVWDTPTIRKYKKQLGPYLALYSGQWPDYSEDLYNRRIATNLSNRTTELHFYARNSAFLYIEGEGYEKYWPYVENIMDPPLVRARGVIFVMLQLQGQIQAFFKELPELRHQDIDIIEQKQAELDKTNRSLMQLITAIRKEDMTNMRAHARALNDHLVNLFRIEEVLQNVQSSLNYAHEAARMVFEEKTRDLQERQERLFLYLNIILGVGIVIEAVNILIEPFQGTTAYSLTRYSMSSWIILLFGFIMLQIFRKRSLK